MLTSPSHNQHKKLLDAYTQCMKSGAITNTQWNLEVPRTTADTTSPLSMAIKKVTPHFNIPMWR